MKTSANSGKLHVLSRETVLAAWAPVFFFAALVASGCSESNTARFVPQEVSPGNYQRIVSLTPSITEIIFALGAGDRVVGVTSCCDYPEQAKELPSVGDFLKPNLEALIALEPDLVILAPTGSLLRQSYDNLASIGMRVLVVWNNTMEETFDAFRIIGRTLKIENEARGLAEEVRGRIRAETGRLAGVTQKKVLWVVGINPMIAVGNGTYQAEILDAAGGKNVISKDLGAWPRINEEFVLQADPDVIIESAMGNEAELGDYAGSLRVWDRYPSITAVRQGMVRLVRHDAPYRPGPRMPEALKMIAEALHPELFKTEEREKEGR